MNEYVVCAILAAGRATRLGTPKAALELRHVTFAERALAASAAYTTVVVSSGADSSLERSALRYGARVVTNVAPERGMSYSLRLANAALGKPHASLAVLLVDTPLVDADVLVRVLAAAVHVDIAYPIGEDGRPGHPVIFGPRARVAIDALPDGDTLRTLRDDPRFKHATVCFNDDRPFADVDTPDDFERLRANHACGL